MIRELHKQLQPLRRRLTLRPVMATVAGALMVGGWLALMGALLALFGGSMTSGLIGAAVVIGLPASGAAWALLHPVPWRVAARAADRHFNLHDRIATALHLAESSSGDPFAQMQIEDAAAKLQQLNLRAVALAPIPWQRLVSGVLLSAFALALTGWAIIAPPTKSIQASGDMQDIRPEIVERVAVQPSAVDAQTALSGMRLSQESLESGDTFQTGLDDVSGRYFDLIDERETESRSP